MTCTCVRDNEKKVAEHMTAKLGVPATASAQGIAFGLTDDYVPVERAYMPYAIKADKPGYRGGKGKEISMFFTYCPWCGAKVEAGEA